MQTFDFKTARTRVTALERKFKAIHDKLKEIALPVETAGTITTMLNDAQTEMTQDILTGILKEPEAFKGIENNMPELQKSIEEISKEVVQQAKEKGTDIITNDGGIVEVNELSK